MSTNTPTQELINAHRELADRMRDFGEHEANRGDNELAAEYFALAAKASWQAFTMTAERSDSHTES